MHPVTREFSLPSQTDREIVTAMIRSSLHCQPEIVSEPAHEPAASSAGGAVVESIRESACRYLDSFDWRLYLAGVALEERVTGAVRELRWLDLGNGGAVVARQSTDAEPGFVDALPQGPVRTLLAPILGIRRLLPMAELLLRVQRLQVLNEDDKTVVRIVVEAPGLIGASGLAEASLPVRLQLIPVRGYADEMADTVRRLEASLGFSAVPNQTPTPLFHEAMAAAGCRPGAYSSKLSYRLDPEQRADAAAKEILLGLMDTLEANIDGTIDNLDSEFLHHLRVATRRTRSALSQFKAVFPASVVDDFKARFAWLQQVTGPVRDLDVYLLDFPMLRDSLPPTMRTGLEPLRDWLGSHYAEEQTALAEALRSQQFQALRRDWRAFLDAPTSSSIPASTSALGDVSGQHLEPLEPPEPTDAVDGGRSIKSVADRRIRGMYKRVRREGRAITDASPAEALHELRKSCKKLRYLMEFFTSLYPRNEIRGPIKRCKVLLDNLGSFQDLEVQADHLAETARRMHAEGAASVATLLSMGALIRTMLDGQQQARERFARTFAKFDNDATRAAFDRLLDAPCDSRVAVESAADLAGPKAVTNA